MRTKKTGILSVILFLSLNFAQAQTTAPAVCEPKSAKKSESEAYKEYKNKKNDGKHFGEAIDIKNAISYADLLTKMQNAKKVEGVKVAGTVEAVCQARGCWMNLKGDNAAQPMMVKFKDYAFFMPKDIKGKKVVMVGEAFKETVSVEELRHYAEDDGKSPEEIAKITKPEDKISFMASGVIVLD